jgi:hypothetical protein
VQHREGSVQGPASLSSLPASHTAGGSPHGSISAYSSRAEVPPAIGNELALRHLRWPQMRAGHFQFNDQSRASQHGQSPPTARQSSTFSIGHATHSTDGGTGLDYVPLMGGSPMSSSNSHFVLPHVRRPPPHPGPSQVHVLHSRPPAGMSGARQPQVLTCHCMASICMRDALLCI